MRACRRRRRPKPASSATRYQMAPRSAPRIYRLGTSGNARDPPRRRGVIASTPRPASTPLWHYPANTSSPPAAHVIAPLSVVVSMQTPDNELRLRPNPQKIESPSRPARALPTAGAELAEQPGGKFAGYLGGALVNAGGQRGVSVRRLITSSSSSTDPSASLGSADQGAASSTWRIPPRAAPESAILLPGRLR